MINLEQLRMTTFKKNLIWFHDSKIVTTSEINIINKNLPYLTVKIAFGEKDRNI